MKKGSEGIRRFRIIISVIASLVWVVFVFGEKDAFSDPSISWVIITCATIGVLLACFLVPWGIERIIYWIYKGFAADLKKKKSQE